ncbi:hypothetical protein KCU83_g1405, partial [Aureobasidium melanogenum]
MRRLAARMTGPPDTVAERAVVSLFHDITLGFLVVAQIAVVILSCVKCLITNTSSLNHTVSPTLNTLKAITRSHKPVIATLAHPFVALLHAINAFCTSICTDPLFHTYFLCFRGLLGVVEWYCAGVDWQNVSPILFTLTWVWLVLAIWAVVAFARHQWRLRKGVRRGKKDSNKVKDRAQEEGNMMGDTRWRKKGKRWPVPLVGTHSRDGSMEDLVGDSKRNWSNENGDLSPKSLSPLKPGTGYPHRHSAGIKGLDEDSNRNWSNEHGNLSSEPARLSKLRGGNYDLVFDAAYSSSATAIFTPRSSEEYQR